MMYHLVYTLLYVFSLLPLKVLYLFSDFFYFLIYYVFGYRKKVVRDNIHLAFPERSAAEKKLIEKKFYHNMVDTVFETIKLFSAGRSFVLKHVKGDIELYNSFARQEKKVQAHLGHNFNWELLNQYAAIRLKQSYIGVYMPLENKTFDRLFRKMRSRFGAILLPARNLNRSLFDYKDEIYVIGLIADQTPGKPDNQLWIDFLGRSTVFLIGPERSARAAKIPVIFSYLTKEKRGYYQLHSELLWDGETELSDGELTVKYVSLLEKTIRQDPSMWLWSHRRWKHEYDPSYGPVLSQKK
jgi:Kdo2-lipid IVA lauroyltransferase/acyltransferase